jgi:hypothetical protein
MVRDDHQCPRNDCAVTAQKTKWTELTDEETNGSPGEDLSFWRRNRVSIQARWTRHEDGEAEEQVAGQWRRLSLAPGSVVQ